MHDNSPSSPPILPVLSGKVVRLWELLPCLFYCSFSLLASARRTEVVPGSSFYVNGELALTQR